MLGSYSIFTIAIMLIFLIENLVASMVLNSSGMLSVLYIGNLIYFISIIFYTNLFILMTLRLKSVILPIVLFILCVINQSINLCYYMEDYVVFICSLINIVIYSLVVWSIYDFKISFQSIICLSSFVVISILVFLTLMYTESYELQLIRGFILSVLFLVATLIIMLPILFSKNETIK